MARTLISYHPNEDEEIDVKINRNTNPAGDYFAVSIGDIALFLDPAQLEDFISNINIRYAVAKAEEGEK
jgi:hypothetical protein